jgi:hypothetical protein
VDTPTSTVYVADFFNPAGRWWTRCGAAVTSGCHEAVHEQAVWSPLKRLLANLAERRIGQLTALVKTQLRRMQYRPGLLEGFLAKTGLDLTLCNPPLVRSSLCAERDRASACGNAQ